MKDKILNALKSKTFFALAINIVIMALIIVVTAFSYDSADDFYNSLYICQYHNYYNNDINYIFATITGSLQYILLNFNCFVLFQILLSCAAFSSVHLFLPINSESTRLSYSLLCWIFCFHLTIIQKNVLQWTGNCRKNVVNIIIVIVMVLTDI